MEGRRKGEKEGRGYLLAQCTTLTLNLLPSPPFPSLPSFSPLPHSTMSPSPPSLPHHPLQSLLTPLHSPPLPHSTISPSPSFSSSSPLYTPFLYISPFFYSQLILFSFLLPLLFSRLLTLSLSPVLLRLISSSSLPFLLPN